MARKMKYWNGTLGGTQPCCIAARSQAEAVQVINAGSRYNTTIGELRTYFSPCWGTDAMAKLGPQDEPGLWLVSGPYADHVYQRVWSPAQPTGEVKP